jgi:hypothetical protein
MRPTLQKIIAILDGTPTGARGQSLVELSITLPLLFVLLLGLAEIGWYADKYLTLLDVAREAGRFGSTKNPELWVDGEEKKYQRMDCEELSTNFDKLPFENQTSWPGPDLGAWGFFTGDERPINYYDGVACSVMGNMAPLLFNDDTDDVVVSVFSFAVERSGTPNARVRIVGRYPSQANECRNDDVADPFDWNHDGDRDPLELEGFDSTWDDVRGYVFRGNHRMSFGGPRDCLGSEFSTVEVEELLDFKDDPDRQRKVEQIANYGLVLVEIFWEHHTLSGVTPFEVILDPDFVGFPQIIHVWAFFPVSGAEPDLDL